MLRESENGNFEEFPLKSGKLAVRQSILPLSARGGRGFLFMGVPMVNRPVHRSCFKSQRAHPLTE